MGKQNATAITEEDKESETKDVKLIPAAVSQESGDGHEEDQTLDYTKEEEGNDANLGVDSVELFTNEIQGSENSDFAHKDDFVAKDQVNEDTTLNPTAGASQSHKSDDLANVDIKADDDVLTKNNEDLSLHLSEVRTGTSSSKSLEVDEGDSSSTMSHDEEMVEADEETSIQNTKEEIGHLMVTKMSETEEEAVIDEVDIPEQSSEGDSSSIESHDEEVFLPQKGFPAASSGPSSTEDETIGYTGESEGVEASTEEEKIHQEIDENANQMSYTDQEIKEKKIEAEKDATDTSLHDKRNDPETNNPAPPHHSKFVETEKSYEVVRKSDEEKDHVADFKDLEIVECNQTYESLHLEGDDQDTNNPESSESEHAADFNDLDIVHSTIEKSPSFQFMSLVTKAEESDQTPLLYHKKSPMRSMSTPATARFVSPLALNENGHGIVKDQVIQEQESHLLKPQKAQKEAEIIELQGSRNRRLNKARMSSGSYFFSSCICCARVEQLPDA